MLSILAIKLKLNLRFIGFCLNLLSEDWAAQGANMIATASLAYVRSVNDAFHGVPAIPVTKLPPAAAATLRRPRRFFRRAEPTPFQRCLAVHMYYAAAPRLLD
jgi:hypothetical protein